MSDDIPEAWAVLLSRKGIKPSYRAISEHVDISHETARRIIRGRRAKDSSVQKLADMLGVDREVIYELRGAHVAPDVWEPPRAASLLSEDERDVLARLISVMTKGREEASDGTPTTTAGSAPATRRARVTRIPDPSAGSAPGPAARRPRRRPSALD